MLADGYHRGLPRQGRKRPSIVAKKTQYRGKRDLL